MITAPNIWKQTLISKKNKSLSPGAKWSQDDLHVLTPSSGPVDGEEAIQRASKPFRDQMLGFIKRDGEHLYVGVWGRVGEVLGEGHAFARELDLTNSGMLGRRIPFTHAYHTRGKEAKIPSLAELKVQQGRDLLHILTEAHAGREPVEMAPVAFGGMRDTGTAWDRIAREVETGKSNGGFFSMNGELVKEFEREVAQKKTPEIMRARKALVVTAVAIAAVVGIGMWMRRETARTQSPADMGRGR